MLQRSFAWGFIGISTVICSDPFLATESPGFCTPPQDDRLATALFPWAFMLPLVVLGILAWVFRRARWICVVATITLACGSAASWPCIPTAP